MILVLQAPWSNVWAEGIMRLINMICADICVFPCRRSSWSLRRRCDSVALKEDNESCEEQRHKWEINKIKTIIVVPLKLKSESQKDMPRSHFTSIISQLFLKGIQGQGSTYFSNESFLSSVLFLIFPFRAKNCMLQQMQTPNFMLFVSCKDVWTPKDV